MSWLNRKMPGWFVDWSVRKEIEEYGCLDSHYQAPTWGDIIIPGAAILGFYAVLGCVGWTVYCLVRLMF